MNKPASNERYTPGYAGEVVTQFQQRTAGREAAFLLPYLRLGFKILDCGCGPGSITCGLAKAVAPGPVTGIDVEITQTREVLSGCNSAGVTNLEFVQGNVYDLPFPDESFDGVFAHALLQHLQDPVRALKEMRRVLKPGGIVGVRDDDRGSLIIAPYDARVIRLIDLLEKLVLHGGGDARIGRRHREVLRKAGFEKIHASASCECDGTPEATRRRGCMAAHAAETYLTGVAVQQGWATAVELKEMATACRTWAEHPDAFDTITWCEAVDSKPAKD